MQGNGCGAKIGWRQVKKVLQIRLVAEQGQGKSMQGYKEGQGQGKVRVTVRVDGRQGHVRLRSIRADGKATGKAKEGYGVAEVIRQGQAGRGRANAG